MSGAVRVFVWHRSPEGDPAPVTRAYDEVNENLRGTPGLLRGELLRSENDDGAMLVMSEWENMDAFLSWERGAKHKGATAPLRPYQDRDRDSTFEIFRVVAVY